MILEAAREKASHYSHYVSVRIVTATLGFYFCFPSGQAEPLRQLIYKKSINFVVSSKTNLYYLNDLYAIDRFSNRV